MLSRFWRDRSESDFYRAAQPGIDRRVISSDHVDVMCRNIKTLFNFAPPATDEEIYAASLQFVRKLSGYTKPSKANEIAFNRAVVQVAAVARILIDTLETSAEPKDREIEAARAKERAAQRFKAT